MTRTQATIRAAGAVALILALSSLLTVDRIQRYARDLRKDEPRYMTKDDVICDVATNSITIKAGNYIGPADQAVAFCPELRL